MASLAVRIDCSHMFFGAWICSGTDQLSSFGCPLLTVGPSSGVHIFRSLASTGAIKPVAQRAVGVNILFADHAMICTAYCI